MSSSARPGARIIAAVRAGTAPRPGRLAAARGALPLDPAELVLLQVLLERDEDPEIAEAAKGSLEGLEPATALVLAQDAELDPAVIDFLAQRSPRWPDAASVLAGRRGLEPHVYRSVAGAAGDEALAILAANQEALAADGGLAALLLDNPALGGQARSRLLDLLDEFAKESAAAAAAAAAAPAEAAPGAIPPPPARDPFLASLGIDAEVESLLPQLDLDLGMLADRSDLLGELEDGDDASLILRLSKMNVGQKLRLSLFGTREERSILVRDSNRLVACSVVRNPKFTVAEAEQVSKSRNVPSEVLRLISRHRDFGASYSIQRNLVVNPRCPSDMALNLVSVLNDHDLKLLLKNRNVRETVRRQAKKVHQVREERKRVRVMPARR